jgi:hypothetical protein
VSEPEVRNDTAREKRERRQQEAAERKAARAKRSSGQQLAVLRERGITSGGEWDRLTHIIESGQDHLRKGG